MPSVFNRRHADAPPDAVYVGRPTKWGNPFSHQHGTLAEFEVKTREEAVANYEEWLRRERPDLIYNARIELKGKDLVCWCAPKACHADILLRIANE